MSRRLLTITLIGGRSLVSADKKGTSNPYAVLTLQDIAGRTIKNENFTTNKKEKTLDPRWDQRINFGKKENREKQFNYSFDFLSISLYFSILTLLSFSSSSLFFCSLLGQHYDLNNVDALPTLRIEVFSKNTSLIGSDTPLGFVEIPLSTIPADGSPITRWHSLQKMPKMKQISGEVKIKKSSFLFFFIIFLFFLT